MPPLQIDKKIQKEILFSQYNLHMKYLHMIVLFEGKSSIHIYNIKLIFKILSISNKFSIYICN